MSSAQVVVGRQPIYDRGLLITGYELLFRPPGLLTGAGTGLAGDEMTTSVLAGALNIGLHRLVGSKDIYCNADRAVLTGSVAFLLPPHRTTVEVTHSTAIDEEIAEGCERLRRAGYRIALDDFDWFDGVDRALALASVVKLDLQTLGLPRVLELAERLRDVPVELLAHKVETEEELNTCLAHGFSYFQGFALARPTVVHGAKLDATRLGVLQIATAAMDPETDITEVERIIRRDPALTVQVLEIAAIGELGAMRRSVRSIRDALVLLGTQRLRSWVTLLLLRSTRATTADQIVSVLLRARACELLADPDDAAFAFTAGMVSALDRFLSVTAEELEEVLPLDTALMQAAFHGEGEVGGIVRRVIRHEADGHADVEMHAIVVRALDWAMQSAELIELS